MPLHPLINTACTPSTVINSINTLPAKLAELTDHEAIKQPSAFGQCGLFVPLCRGCEPGRLPGTCFSPRGPLLFQELS
ncbi:Guanylate Cyclase Soluble Subunit Beta-2 [Manis pentadactyla]|nr:Guanylate Cyclase Soluble Subunit Beta-2 [Manis pentadactyla]